MDLSYGWVIRGWEQAVEMKINALQRDTVTLLYWDQPLHYPNMHARLVRNVTAWKFGHSDRNITLNEGVHN